MTRPPGQPVPDLNAVVGTEFAPEVSAPKGTAMTNGQPRLRGKFAAVRQVGTSMLRIGGGARTMAKAPADGVYTLNGRRFRARQGDPLPEGAEFSGATERPAGRRASNAAMREAANPATGETEPEGEREVLTEDHPKWYLAYVAKQAKAGAEVQPMYVGETEAAFTERLGAMGPESTEGTGGAETT